MVFESGKGWVCVWVGEGDRGIEQNWYIASLTSGMVSDGAIFSCASWSFPHSSNSKKNRTKPGVTLMLLQLYFGTEQGDE